MKFAGFLQKNLDALFLRTHERGELGTTAGSRAPITQIVSRLRIQRCDWVIQQETLLGVNTGTWDPQPSPRGLVLFLHSAQC